jgi:hypothetical protein
MNQSGSGGGWTPPWAGGFGGQPYNQGFGYQAPTSGYMSNNGMGSASSQLSGQPPGAVAATGSFFGSPYAGIGNSYGGIYGQGNSYSGMSNPYLAGIQAQNEYLMPQMSQSYGGMPTYSAAYGGSPFTAGTGMQGYGLQTLTQASPYQESFYPYSYNGFGF